MEAKFATKAFSEQVNQEGARRWIFTVNFHYNQRWAFKDSHHGRTSKAVLNTTYIPTFKTMRKSRGGQNSGGYFNGRSCSSSLQATGSCYS